VRDFLLRLYPAAWRTRYGDEFDALLAERHLGPFDVADVLLGAVDAHVHRRGDPASEHGKGLTMSRHLGGTAAVIAGCLMLVGLAMGPLPNSPSAAVMFVGLAMLLPALAGLSSFQSRRHPIITWAAFGIPAVGIVTSCLAGIAGALPWDHPLYNSEIVGSMLTLGVVTTLAGSALFAAVTYRTRTLPRPAIGSLGLGSGLPLVGIALFVVPLPELWSVGRLFYEVGAIAFPIGWIAVGWSAIRLDRRIAVEASPHREGWRMSLHTGGAAAVLGGSLWLAGMVLNMRSGLYGNFAIVAGMGALVVALAGLSAFRSRQHPILTGAAFVIPAFGMVLSSVASLYSWYTIQPIDDWVGVPQILGSVASYGGTALFAALTYRAGALPRRAPLLLGLGAVLVLVGLVEYFSLAGDSWAGRGLLYGVGFFLVPFAWIALGWSAIRLDRRTALTATPAAA